MFSRQRSGTDRAKCDLLYRIADSRIDEMYPSVVPQESALQSERNIQGDSAQVDFLYLGGEAYRSRVNQISISTCTVGFSLRYLHR